MIRFRDVSTRVKLTLAFGILLAAAVAMIVLVAFQLHAIRSAARQNSQSEQIIRLSHIAEKGLIRINSQMRGVLLTRNFSYLDTYREGMIQFTGSMASLSTLVDQPEQHALIRQAVAANRDWRHDYGDHLIAMAGTDSGRLAAIRILTEAGEKPRITYITRMVQGLREIEERRMASRQRELNEALGNSSVVLTAGGICLLTIALLMAWLLTALIARPVERLTGIVDRLTRQDFAAAIPADQRDRGDEVGRIARALDIFRLAGLENRRLEQEAAALRDIRTREAEEAARRARDDAGRDRATIRIIGEGLAAIARGDLTFRLADGLSSDAAVLKDDYDAAVVQLSGLLRRVQATVAAVDRDANGIAAASGQLAERTVQQANAIGVVGDRLAQLTETIRQNTSGARRVEEVARSTRDSAERSRDTVAAAVTAMARIDSSSEQIGTITDLVRSIAEQTRLLALNAQMEAARAGSAGAGFAVVAKEVSVLAGRLREATEQIGESLALARACAVEGVDLVGAASTKLGVILRDVGEVSMLVGEMAVAADRQARDVRDVDDRMRDIARFTERNAAMAGDATAICTTLVTGAHDLARSLVQFRIDDAAAVPA